MRAEIERVKNECVIGSPFESSETRLIIEDMILYGAVAISRNGYPVEVETITKIIDQNDKTPDPPNPAYQQIFDGRPLWVGTANDLLFMEFTNFLGDGDKIDVNAIKGNLNNIRQEFDAMVERSRRQ